MIGEASALSAAVARPHHLLAVAADVDPDEVLSLALTHFDDADRLDATTVRLTGEAILTGPWRLTDELRGDFDLPAWAEQAFVLRCPVHRSSPVPSELRGMGGLLDAFPDGPPVALEGLAVNHLLAQARRLAGALRIAGTGSVMVPRPAPDLTLHSPVWLEPEAGVRVARRGLPALRDEVPPEALEVSSAILARGAEDRERAAEMLGEERRRALHEWADGFDGRAVANPADLIGYGCYAELDTGGAVEVRVAGDVTPSALRAVPWARGGVVSYEVRWHPEGDAGRGGLAHRRATEAARSVIERVVVALHAAAGGDICDDDGFLVDAEALERPES